MKVIDSHIHIGSWKNPDFFARRVDAAGISKTMEEFGISKAVIMPTDLANNDESLGELQTWPRDKFRFIPWIKPGSGSSLKFCQSNLSKIGGLKFHPSLDKTRITDASYADSLDFAEENKLPVSVHCGRWEEIAGWQYPVELAKKRPHLKIILAHMGGDTPKLAFGAIQAVIVNGLDNVFFDTAGFREYWVIEKGVRDLGAGHFLFASDFPLGHPAAGIALINGMDTKKEEKEAILFKNAESLFGF
jgi:predicted TIM-barrel fold metal-dependent hydrolase